MSPIMHDLKSQDFPRLRGPENFEVWKTRVEAALDGKGLLGFITKENYQGDSDSEEDEEQASVYGPPLRPDDALFDQEDDDLDPNNANNMDGSCSSSSSSASSAATSTLDDDNDSIMSEAPAFSNLPHVDPFSSSTKSKRSKRPSAKALRTAERKARAFLVKTVDDTHVLLIFHLKTAFETYQFLCEKYQGSDALGDSYNLLSSLMEMKFDEESVELTQFILAFEKGLKDTAVALETNFSDHMKSVYLFHALPTSWKQQLSIWKGVRRFIPYNELKQHIERTVRFNAADARFKAKRGSPESSDTKAEKALSAVTSEATDERRGICNYCGNPGHEMKECRTLVRHLQRGQVKPGTVLPPNFIMPKEDTGRPPHGRPQPYDRNRSHQGRVPRGNGYRSSGDNSYRTNGDRGDKGDELYDRHGNKVDVQALMRASNNRPQHHRRQERRPGTGSDEFGVIAFSLFDHVPVVHGLAAIDDGNIDFTWTVDSGSTRHVAYQKDWFATFEKREGHNITVGGKHKIPIVGAGTVKMKVYDDDRQQHKVIELRDVLYAPELKFNLFSVTKAVKDAFVVMFNEHECTLTHESRFKVRADAYPPTNLYQFDGSPAPDVPYKEMFGLVGTNPSPGESKLLTIHKRLGHPNFRVMQDMCKNDTVLDFPLRHADFKEDLFCSACVYAKSHKSPFNTRPVERAKYPLQKVHSDICGPLPEVTLQGHRYFLTFIDDYSRFTFIYVIARRSDLHASYEDFRRRAVCVFRNDVEILEYRDNKYDPEIQVLQADNAKEYEKLGRTISATYGTKAQFTNAYTPAQNGVAERRMRTLLERTRAFLIDGGLSKRLWGEAVKHANSLINCTPSSVTMGKTPYELWNDRKPSMMYFRVFGCVAYAHIDDEHRNKLEPRARLCMYVGIPDHKRGYRLLDPATGHIVYSRNVQFREHKFPPLVFLGEKQPTLPVDAEVPPVVDLPHTPVTTTPSSDEPTSTPSRAPTTSHELTSTPSRASTTPVPTVHARSPIPPVHLHAQRDRAVPAPSNPGTFTTGPPALPQRIDDDTVEFSFVNIKELDRRVHESERIPKRVRFTPTSSPFPDEIAHDLLTHPLDTNANRTELETTHSLLAARHTEEPRNYKEAMNSVQRQEWLDAMRLEYQSLQDNKTWSLVARPPGRKILTCRWVWAIKYDAHGDIDRYKARLVIRGFLQQYGIDYNEIFAPVIRMEVLRLLLTIAALLDFEIHQMDVKTAFLNGFLDEDIYMAQPEGFEEPGKEHLVCKLHKSLYGLKQAPRVWYQTLCEYLEGLRFKRLIKDRCVFVGTFNGQLCYIAVYVDDLLIMAPNQPLVDQVKSALNARFKMSDLGEVSYLLGWSIIRNRAERTIFIHQEAYAIKVLERFNHSECHPVSTPLDASSRLTKDMCASTPDEIQQMERIPYREAVGSFMYLMMGTRPDLANFLRETSQFLATPGSAHWNAVKRGLRYLKGTRSHGIWLGGNESKIEFDSGNFLSAYSDADYSNCVDTRRSVGGYITFFCSSPISWLSRKHHTVTLSTAEAEYMALCQTVQEVTFLMTILSELGLNHNDPVVIFEDNQSCIKIANNPELHGRSKHIDVRYHFVQEKVERNEITIKYCNTTEMIADIFTKALAKPQFEYLKSKLRNVPHNA
jgi:hypothetical protein